MRHRLSWFIALASVTAVVTGCVQTQVMRQVQIHKDASGNVTGFTEVESAIQMGAAFKFSGFQYLKAGPGETEPLKIY